MDKKIKKGFTKGLLLGYAGKSSLAKIKRGKFVGVKSVVASDKWIYRDEWFVDERVGGGQELIELVNGIKYTRVYAGGTVKQKELIDLGIDLKTVGDKLKEFLNLLGSSTRLDVDCFAEIGKDWEYEYRITSDFDELGIIVSIELLRFKGVVVHVHPFIISPIK